MGFQVIIMRPALRDLDEIERRIIKDDPPAAERFRNQLIDRIEPLSDFPEMGRAVPEFTDLNPRELIYKSYRIIYRVRWSSEKVTILRFWHSARGTPHFNL
jgi:plasmid stabilization system protein ParE